MASSGQKTWGKTALAAAASSIAIIGAAPVALAQSPIAASKERQISLEAQPLKDAIVALSDVYGVSVFGDEALLAGKITNSIAGQYSAQAALATLLNGTGIEARPSQSGGYVLVKTAVEDVTPQERSMLVADTIVVSGEKRVRSIQDTQASILALTEAQIRTTYTPDFEELILRLPNISDFQGDSGFVVRGIPQGGPTAGVNFPTSNLTFTIYLDDIPLSSLTQSLAGAFGAWDLQQVEVFRGPQSTIQGRNALAGAIFINSKDPTYDFTGDAQAVFGSFNTQQYSAAIGGPVIDDKVAFRLSYDHQESDGFVTNTFLDDDKAGRNNAELVRGKLLIEPIDDLSIRFTGIYSDNFDTSGQTFADTAVLDATGEREFATDVDLFQIDESFHVGMRIDYSLVDDWTFTSLTSYTDGDRSRNADFDATPMPLFTLEEQTAFVESFTQEFRTVYDAGGSLSFIAGLFYADIELENTVRLVSASAPAPIIQGDTESTENFGIFGEAEWRATDKLSLVAGLRYDTEDVTSVNTVTGVVEDASFDAFLPKAQVIYSWTDNISASFTYQRGYRAGGAVFSPIFNRNFSFDAEFTNNYEVALRSQFLGGRLTANLNLFYIDWTDQQINALVAEVAPELLDEIDIDVFDPSMLTIPVNAGESEVYGVEAQVEYRPLDSLTFFGSVGVQQTEFIEFGDFNGNEFSFAPPVSASIGGNYEHSSGIFLNANAAYTSARFSDNANTPLAETDPLTIVNLRVGYRLSDQTSLSFFANNLLDDNDLTQLAPVLTPTGQQFGSGGSERILGMQLRAGF